MHKPRRGPGAGLYGIILTGAVLTLIIGAAVSRAGSGAQQMFDSPGAAVKAMLSALETKDGKALKGIFGEGSADILSSGDPVADEAVRERFIRLLKEKHRLQEESEGGILLRIGNEDWPFPIPIVRKGSLWHFDTREGREEILARRIGRNELSAIQVCLGYVDAQREFAMKDRDNDGLLAYARKLRSDPGKRNGLYWEAGEEDGQSPLGPFVAAAQEEGYALNGPEGRPTPYHGYYYRILSAQGEHAPGGAYDYVVKGEMLGGFAMVAYPAHYRASGVMTFLVNHDGIVYQKDLGEGTQKEAQAMTRFNPDGTWQSVAKIRAGTTP